MWSVQARLLKKLRDEVNCSNPEVVELYNDILQTFHQMSVSAFYHKVHVLIITNHASRRRHVTVYIDEMLDAMGVNETDIQKRNAVTDLLLRVDRASSMVEDAFFSLIDSDKFNQWKERLAAVHGDNYHFVWRQGRPKPFLDYVTMYQLLNL